MVRGRTNHEPDDGVHLSKRVLVSTRSFPPVMGGTPIIMKNLLDGLHPDSVVLVTRRPLNSDRTGDEQCRVQRYWVEKETSLPPRLEKVRRYFSRPLVTRRMVRIGSRTTCGAVLGVYPDLLFLDAAEHAARVLGVPFFPYLHDTVAEAASSSRFAGWAQRIQNRVFQSAARVFVATGGMAELYERKYGLNSVGLVHIYPEEIPDALPADPAPRRALLWAGNTYNINSISLLRVYEAMRRVGGLRLTMATGQRPDELEKMGFGTDLVDRVYVPVSERPRYLELIRDHAVLVLALNWPDETCIHEDELATIFPTKTPEYLASGRPILVHCPENYHLARFIREHDCGEVVSERSVEAIEKSLKQLLSSDDLRNRLGRNALKAAHIFSRDRVIPLFVRTVETALSDE